MADSAGTRLVRRSPLAHAHRSLGAQFRPIYGWEMVASYRAVEQERAALLDTGGICDVSDTGKLMVQGTEALAGLRTLLGVETLSPGSVHAWAEHGGDSPVTVAALTPDEALVICAPHEEALVGDAVEKALNGCAHVTGVTSTRAGVLVMGPRAQRVLSRIVEFDTDPRAFPDGACAQGRAAGTHVLLMRTDAFGIPVYDLCVTRDHAEHLWDALLAAGRNEGVGPVGLDAVEALGKAE